MAFYARSSLVLKIGHVSDFSDNTSPPPVSFDHTASRYELIQVNVPSPGPVVVELGQFTSVVSLIIRNRGDTGNTGVVATTHSAGGTTVLNILPGDWIKIGDVLVANDISLAATAAATDVDIYILAS